jgi:hypothetical protein
MVKGIVKIRRIYLNKGTFVEPDRTHQDLGSAPLLVPTFAFVAGFAVQRRCL